jgi:GNAT superfamily N-acetyltransferase
MHPNLRQLHFPQDFPLLRDLFERGYVHPEHPEWNEDEELEALVSKMASVQRLWPFFRPFFPALPRMFAGLVWEEDGQPLGAVSAVIRSLGSRDYVVSSAVVLPSCRGRGIGMHLVGGILELLAGWGATNALATCISSNTPIIRIALEQGAHPFDHHHDLRLPAGGSFSGGALPASVRVERVRGAAWQELITFAQGLKPAEAQRFDPVRPDDFHPNPLVRLGFWLSNRMTGYHDGYYALREGDALRGYIYANRPRRADRTTRLEVRLEPAHAPRLAEGALTHAISGAPGPVTMGVPAWQPALLAAACAGGFTVRREWTHLGYPFKGES